MRTSDFVQQKSPGSLFIELWNIVARWTSQQRNAADFANEKTGNYAAAALSLSDQKEVYNELSALLPKSFEVKDLALIEKSAVLVVMQAIDRAFIEIHPRSKVLSASAADRLRRPQWLQDAMEYRTLRGYYCSDRSLCLVPRGPLRSSPRDEDESNAEVLADRFPTLAVVPRTTLHDGRVINLRTSIIGRSKVVGVPTASPVGKEKISVIPVLEESSDLSSVLVKRGHRTNIDFLVAEHINVPVIVAKALEDAGDVDIAVVPEYTVSEAAADELCELLATESTAQARLIVAGSGPTHEAQDGQRWNECRVVNSLGHTISRQRKIWPAAVSAPRAEAYGLPPNGSQRMLQEDSAAGDCVEILDIESLGRCVVFLCQDFEADPVASIIKNFQPDWIFVPILDMGVRIGSWSHQQAFGTSKHSYARYLVFSSTALAKKIWPDGEFFACGMAVGPRDIDLPVKRAMITVTAKLQGQSRMASFAWCDISWQQSDLGQT